MAPIFTGRSFGFGRSSAEGPIPFSATGGTISTPGNGFRYHAFTFPNADNFVVTGGSGIAQVLIVAGGGGGGGGYYTGGAGAGGVVYGATIPLSPGTYPVTVGDGGAGSPGLSGTSGDGSPSSFNAVTALGGGGGGSGPGNPDGGRPGGSAGGSDYYTYPGINPTAPQPVPVSYIAYGNVGGASRGAPGSAAVGGGGGGAGGAGSFQQGGNGQPFPQFAGPLIPVLIPVVPRMGPTADYYGGGGSGATPGVNLAGGFGGGGTGTTGGTDPSPTITAIGANGLGGGGGGRGNPNGAGGKGGSGVVIIRYQV